MKLLFAIFILIITTWGAQGKPNQCCSNNMPIIPRQGCSNNGTYWIREVKCSAYSVSMNDTNTQISEDDSLVLSDVAIVPKDRYCIGSIRNNSIALVCFPDAEENGNFCIIIICMIITISSLIVTLGVYLFVPKLRDLQGKCIMIMIFSLLMSNIFLITLKRSTNYAQGMCYFIAISIYFWFLCTFFWMNVISFHIWRTITKPSFPENTGKIFKFYNIYGWGCPSLILLIANIAYFIPGNHVKPSWGVKSCWFHDYYSNVVYFTVPILILIIINLIMFILSAWSLRKQSSNGMNEKLRSRKYKFVLYLKLFLIMGICWIFEPIEMFFQYEFLATIWLVTNIINASQGLIIFLILILFRKRVRRELSRHKSICCKKLPEDWATLASADCEELSEQTEKLTTAVSTSED